MAQGYDAFLIFPADVNGTNGKINELADKNIPVILVGGPVNEADQGPLHASHRCRRLGLPGHQAPHEAMGGKGKIMHGTGFLVDPNTQLRIDAVKKAVDETNGAVTILQTLADIDSQEAADKAINSFLAAQKDNVDGIITTAYVPSVVSATALRNIGDKRIKMVGIDDDPIMLNAIKDGFASGTMVQNPYGQAYIGAYVMDLIFNGYKKKSDAPFKIDSGTMFVPVDKIGSYRRTSRRSPRTWSPPSRTSTSRRLSRGIAHRHRHPARPAVDGTGSRPRGRIRALASHRLRGPGDVAARSRARLEASGVPRFMSVTATCASPGQGNTGATPVEQAGPVPRHLFLWIVFAVFAPAFVSDYNMFTLLRFVSVDRDRDVADVDALDRRDEPFGGRYRGGLRHVRGRADAGAGPPPVVAVAAGLGLAVVAGATNGLLVTRTGINSFIITLATASMFTGLMFSLTKAKAYDALPPSFVAFGAMRLFGLPLSPLVLVMLVVGGVLWFIYGNTVLGREMLAAGANRRAAAMSGVPVPRLIILSHVLSGIAAGVAGT